MGPKGRNDYHAQCYAVPSEGRSNPTVADVTPKGYERYINHGNEAHAGFKNNTKKRWKG